MIICPKLKDIKEINHGFFTREGGVSDGLYSSLNCGPGSDDNPDNVTKNRAIVAEKIGVDADRLYTLYQCHTNEVEVIDSSSGHNATREADAMVTQEKSVALGILAADCAPVLFADSVSGTIGAAHAGWKGVIGGILENTVAEMYDLGANHHDIVATIGPCIGPDSYEISEEFKDNFLQDDPDNYQFFKITTKSGHHLFDLPGYSKNRLEKLGLKSVQWVDEDTLPQEDKFFSYRRTTLNGEKDYGRQISVITMV